MPKGQDAAIATRQGNDFVIVNRDGGSSTLYFGDIPEGSGYGHAATVAEGAVSPRIATNAGLSAIVYHIKDTQTVDWVRVNASLVVGSPSQITGAGINPDITGTTTGYAIAWSTKAGFAYQSFDTSGTSLCGPTEVAFGNNVLDAQDGVAVATTQYGVVVLAGDQGGSLHLYRFDAACKVVDDQNVQAGITSAYLPSMAVGGGKLALSWTDYLPSGPNGYVRVLNERLCQ